MGKKKLVKFFGIFLICLSTTLITISILFSNITYNQRLKYLEEENIYFERISIKTRDGVEIKGLLYIDKDLEKLEDHSIPTILLLHGINGRKEQKFFKIYQFVKLGYAIVSVEQRGHGESGGISAFIGKEPEDMMEVIDYIKKEYSFSNSSNIAILAFSFGGGIGTVLQAIDDRIYASVIYHPLSSIDNLRKQIPFDKLIGKTPAIDNLDNIDDGFDVCTPNNTENLLLIHGEDDDIISPKDSENLYEQVNGPIRKNIGLELRPGLGHGENEQDEDSFRYTIVWLEHFYHNRSINITNRDKEIKFVKFSDYNYPTTFYSQNFLLIGCILMFIGLSFLLLPFKIWPFSKEIFSEKENIENTKFRKENYYKKMILFRCLFYIFSVIVVALICSYLNPSYIYGYFLFFPSIVIIFMLFIHNPEYNDWKSEWKSWYEKDLKIFLLGLSIIVIPVLIYIFIYNYNAYLMITPPIPFFT
ncbi:MAG: alpha/beta hydrolase, partial [Promethearchaeota archaeon]